MCMACTVERLRQEARNAPVVLLLGRLKNEGLDPQFPNLVTWRPPTQLGTNERRRRRRRPHGQRAAEDKDEEDKEDVDAEEAPSLEQSSADRRKDVDTEGVLTAPGMAGGPPSSSLLRQSTLRPMA